MIGVELTGANSPMGRYKLLALLGQGGMADVYLAQSKGAGGFQKLLVVKLARFTGDPMYATMFLDEARLAAQLSHPHIVQTYEIGEEGTRNYIVMEFLDGGTFARLRRKAVANGGLPLNVSVHILLQVLDALTYAHDARGIDGQQLKVVHRDMSPDNILVTSQGIAKVLDFGISKAADSQSFTHTGRLSGKLTYMPPEQLRGERVDRRADLFAVGVLLAESVLGESLWANVAEPALASQLGRGEIPSLDRVPFDPELRRICEKALAPNPEDRYDNAGTFRQELLAYAATLAPVTAAMVGALVSDLLKTERDKLQRTIESQLHRDDVESLGRTYPLPNLEYTPTDVRASRPVTRHEETDEMVLETFPAAPAEVAPKINPIAPAAIATTQKSRLPLFAGIGAGVVAVGAMLAWFTLRPSGSPSSLTVQPGAPLATKGMTSIDATAAVRIEIVVSPAQAVVQLDGRQLGRNPWVGAMSRDGVVHSLIVMAPGYKSIERDFVLDHDVSFDFALVPELAAAPVERVPAKVVGNAVKKDSAVPVKAAVLVNATGSGANGGSAVGSAVGATAGSGSQAARKPLDEDIYEKPKRRPLDSNALDTKPATPTIDRENPWQK